jgi:hypothetical protein
MSNPGASIEVLQPTSPLISAPQGVSASATQILIAGAALPLQSENGWTVIPTIVDRLAASLATPAAAHRATVDHVMSESAEHRASSWQSMASAFQENWRSQSPHSWSADLAIDDKMFDMIAVASLGRITKPDDSGK